MQQGKLNVFRASAGSGKTFEITAQYISLLLAHEVATPHSILAVTFTQKATLEMKSRILESLYDIAHHDLATPPDSFLQKIMEETSQTAEVLKQRAVQTLHSILHAYDDFYVQTIDSFLQSLLRGLAHELGLMANYQVELRDAETIQMAVERLMKDLGADKSLFHWVTRFAMDRLDEEHDWSVVDKIKYLAKQITNEQYAQNSHILADKLTNEHISEYQQTLRKKRTSAREEIRQEATALLQKFGDLGFKNVNNIIKFLKACQESEEPEKTKIQTTVTNYLSSIDNWIKASDPAYKKAEMREAAETLYPQFVAFHDHFANHQATINSCVLSLQHLGALRLLEEINQRITTLCNETGRFLLKRTPLLFESLVRSDDTSFIYERAGVQFKHIMIDEFQDTSSLQWATFKRLIDETLATANHSMVVGDVKQSIYRWRGGDWEILQGMEQQFLPKQLYTTSLDTNYRSDKAIVDFNNRLFTYAPTHALFAQHISEEQKTILHNIYSDVAQHAVANKDMGYVRVSIGNMDKWADIECDEDYDGNPMLDDLVQQILALHTEQQVRYSDMAILVRKKGDACKVINYMAYRYPEIPLVSAEAFRLDSSPAVLMVIACLKILWHKDDTAAKAEMLYHYYNTFLHQNRSLDDIILHHNELLPEPLSQEWVALKRMPLYERCERIIALLCLNEWDGQQGYLFTFLDEVKSFLKTERSDIALFLRHWDEKMCEASIASQSVDGVNFVTIHSSKGLAFHTVFLPYTTWKMHKTSSQYQPQLLWCNPTEAPYNDIPLLPIEHIPTMQQSVYQADYEAENYRQRVDNLNLLYVALTRAKHCLYIWVNEKENQKTTIKGTIGEILHDFVMPEDQEAPYLWEAGQRSAITISEQTDTQKTERENPLRAAAEGYSLRMSSEEGHVAIKQNTRSQQYLTEPTDEELQQQAYIDKGKLLHGIFEHIASRTDISRAVQEAVISGILSKDKASGVETFVRQRISEGQAAEWFDGSWTLYRECVILQRSAGGKLQRKRPDRVMVNGDRAIVVDYKFGKPHIEHAHQVSEYMQLLRRMGYKDVKGYVWYVFQNRVVPVE